MSDAVARNFHIKQNQEMSQKSQMSAPWHFFL